jgi:hypothetical protein
MVSKQIERPADEPVLNPLDRLNIYAQALVARGVMLNANIRISVYDRGRKVKVWIQGDQMVKIGRSERKIGNTRLLHPDTGAYLEAVEDVDGLGASAALDFAIERFADDLWKSFDLES